MALISAGLLSLASCEKKGSEEPTTKTTLTTSMEQQGGNTKTSFDQTTKDVLWSSGDRIAVFFGDLTTNNEFTLASGEGTKSGTFTGSGSDAKAYAFYPYNAGVTISDTKTISFTLPSEQTYRPEGGFATDMNPMVAYRTAEGTLEFKNLCGILKITLNASSGKTIKRIIVRSQTTKLSGKATVAMTYTAGNPEIVMADDAEYTVALNLGASGVTLDENRDFYIVVPPIVVKAENKLTVHVESTTGGMLKSTQKESAAVDRSVITPMKGFNYADDAINYLENGFNFGSGVNIAGKTFAPVNCGYEPATETPEYKGYPYGKLYQWGRKYGQGYMGTTTIGETNYFFEDASYPSGGNLVSAQVSSEEGRSIPNQYKFYMDNEDWCDDAANKDKLWNSGSEATPIKTVNDPCPAGWRVPTEPELKALRNLTPSGGFISSGTHGSTGTLQGWNFTSGGITLFLPAAGFRDFYDGSAWFRGIGSRYWSSSSGGITSCYLGFYSFGADMGDSGSRGNGFSVRCVKN